MSLLGLVTGAFIGDGLGTAIGKFKLIYRDVNVTFSL